MPPERLLDRLRLSDDFTEETLDNGIFRISLLYFNTMCDKNVVKDEICRPFLRSGSEEAYLHALNSAVSCRELEDDQDLIDSLLQGFVIIQFRDKLYKLKAEVPGNNQSSEVTIETTLQGPKSAFTEDVDTNLMILRRRCPALSIVAEACKLGKVSQTKAYVVYDSEKVDRKILQELKDKLGRIQADQVISAGQIEVLITKSKFRWFPIAVLTERPDRAAMNVTQGKIVLLINGTPFVLIAPVVFYDFISAMDDLYQTRIVTIGLVFLRYISILVTMTLPALYVAIVSYNPEVLRVQFTLSLAGSRAAVPYPSYLEVLLMLFLIEALIEASIRLPRYIGATATTVGGLILGQAAQQAGLVSSVMIIITSVVAITNFLIPINAMSFAIRVAKYPLVLMACLFGIVGVVAGMYVMLIYAGNLRSFGLPYFRFFIGEPAVSGYKQGGPQ